MMKAATFDKTLENFQRAIYDLSVVLPRVTRDVKKDHSLYDLKDLAQACHLIIRTVQMAIENAKFWEVKSRIEVMEQIKADLPFCSVFTEEERTTATKVLTWMQEDALAQAGSYEPKRDQFVLPLGGV